eukprot:TRINITY_DN56_c0_g1_i10.p1 TRINITY_DN56_c0_g1~~TRINITY_DN56_c0_g1_i10.p1  ORF type:complete len:166 (-),score=27.66 TRINITY_DN56_c0_g1_i10:79-576(-)
MRSTDPQQAGNESTYSSANVHDPLNDSSNTDTTEQPPKKRRTLLALALLGAAALACVTVFLSGKTTEENKMLHDTLVLTASASSATYADFGKGKCTLPDGSDPKFAWKGSGNVKAMCDADETCLGYSASMYGGGLLWKSGPLQGGGAEWGACHCNVKEETEIAGR